MSAANGGPSGDEVTATPPPAEEGGVVDVYTPKVSLRATSILYISMILTGLFLYGLYDYAVDLEDNRCSMTFMYEYPQYIKIMTFHSNQNAKFYDLYAYGEGKMAERVREGKFDGIPVLFVPGNSGSHRQVRSMASVALRKALEQSNYRLHFDYFSVDFNEEFSAIYGGVLEDQSSFLAHCVDMILSLYEDTTKGPRSVVIIGHSIGGLVAKSLFWRPEFKADKVNMIVTLATPHFAPVVVSDHYLKQFYEKTNGYWDANRNTSSLEHVTLVSVGGGVRDVQVRSSLTSTNHADLSVQTTSAPAVWVSADHQCIVWCKQLVLALNRALFDSIDANTKQMIQDKTMITKIFNYHLLQRSFGNKFKELEEEKTTTFDQDGDWKDLLKRQFVFGPVNVTKNTYLMVKTLDDPKHKFLTVDAVNMDLDDWVFACKATKVHKNVVMCESGQSMSSQSTIVPSNGKRKTLQVNLDELRTEKGYTHVVVHVAAGMNNVRVNLDVYNPKERQFDVNLPRWISFSSPQTVMKASLPGAVFYNLTLKELDHTWQAYDVSVDPIGRCPDRTHYGLMRFQSSWAADSTSNLIGFNMTNKLLARLATPKPSMGDPSHKTEVLLYLNPNCRYRVSVRPSLRAMWGQIVRYYLFMLLPFAISATIMVLVNQVKLLEQEGAAYAAHKILWSQMSPVSCVMPAKLLAAVLTLESLSKYVPETDFFKLTSQGLDFGVLPIMFYFVAIGTVLVISGAAMASVILMGHSAHRLISRYQTSSSSEVVAAADVVLAEGIGKFPVVLAVAFIAASTSSCGTVGLCLGTFANFLHLFNLYKDHLESMTKNAVGIGRRRKLELSTINFQFTLSLLWVFATVLNMPSLMAWSHSIPESVMPLYKDPSFIPSVVLCACLPLLWNSQPDPSKVYYTGVATTLQFMSIVTILYGCITIYISNYVLCVVFAVTALQQQFAPSNPDYIEPIDTTVEEDGEEKQEEKPEDEKKRD